MFDADPRAFGAYRVRDSLGAGRFGPVFSAVDAGGAPVVVRTIAAPLGDEQRTTLLAALEAICEAPLDHPGIVRPRASGSEAGVPFVVHDWAPGELLEARLARDGTQPLAELLPALTRVAAALDFAAAGGVYHGALTAGDILIHQDDAAVIGIGVAEAMVAAGVPAETRSDVESLARIVYAAIGEQPLRLELPDSALGLIAQFQAAAPPEAPPPMEIAPTPQREMFAGSPSARPAPAAERQGWSPVAAVMVALLAAAIGFGGGYLAGRSGDVAPSVTVAPPAPSAPAATSGLADAPPLEVPVAAPAVESPASVPAAPQPPPRGALDVRSLPTGARVFVDGELVGSTPLILRDVTPGTHAVRLDLPGFRPWVSRVDVERGGTARVAGSLDR